MILATAQGAAPLNIARPADDNLTYSFAQFRKNQIKSVSYDLNFILNKGSEEFNGKTIITAELARTDAPLSIDFIWKKIIGIRVNGTALSTFVERKGSIDIAPKYLTKSLQIEIEYIGAFNKDGAGFQRVVDPEDSSEYLFTDFEPYHAHHLFPCFDQPDLKATYKVTVNAPSEWKVISNDLIQDSQSDKGRVTTTFAKSKLISPYLFFLGAGPFVEWTDKAGEIPLVLYARKTLSQYVDHEKIFDTTKKGLKFFSEYFGHEYPFPKYGQIFIPEFAWGGMENPGAVSLNERNIFRGPVSQSRIEGRDDLILHEMAHMWFGDLVTMHWWNDLWLNESFASYMASVAQDRALQSKGTWIDFFSTKTWGYWQDQLVTTHPIETKVSDVRTAKGNFDGITYAKGASALKQLHFFAGEEGFRDGVRSYFKKYAFQNTSRKDFIAEIAHASKQDLATWTKAWLQTAGPNRVQAKWDCSNGLISSFHIEQLPSSSKTLAPHKTKIGLFNAGKEGTWVLANSQDVSYFKKTTAVPELKGTACPEFVYPNIDDQDYALFSLDPTSLKSAKKALTGNLPDPLLRLMVWSTLAQMVRDSELAVDEYFDMALAGIEKETNDPLLGVVLGRHSVLREYYRGFLTETQRAALAPRFESTLWSRVLSEKSGSSLQMIFYDFYVSIAQTSEAKDRLHKILLGKDIPSGINVDQDRRWEIIGNLASNNFDGIVAIIDNEEKKDPSTAGKRYAYTAKVAIPTVDAKKAFWAVLEKPDQIPYSTLRSASSRFNHWDYTELSEPYIKPFFKAVTSMNWEANDNLLDIYFENLFPANLCSAQLLAESKKEMQRAKNLIPLARRAWLEANDELEKCVAVRKKSLEPMGVLSKTRNQKRKQ